MPLPTGLLQLLESDERFHLMCFRLARKVYPAALPTGIGSWDGGRDILLFDSEQGDVRGGSGISDTGISGFLSGPNRREVHAKAKT